MHASPCSWLSAGCCSPSSSGSAATATYGRRSQGSSSLSCSSCPRSPSAGAACGSASSASSSSLPSRSAFRAAAFVPGETPPLSTDLHRYAWDARVQASGINPYRYAPLDGRLVELRDDLVWPQINLPAWHTVYPPGAEASFLAARGVFGDGLRSTTWFVPSRRGGDGRRCSCSFSPGCGRGPPSNGSWLRVASPGGQRDRGKRPRRRARGARSGRSPRCLAGSPVRAGRGRGRPRRAGEARSDPARPCSRAPGRAPVRRDGAPARACSRISRISRSERPCSATSGTTSSASASGAVSGGLSPARSATTGPRPCSLSVWRPWSAWSRFASTRRSSQVARSCLLVLGSLLLVVSYVQPWHALWLLPFFAIVVTPGWLWLTGTLPLLYLFELEWQLPIWVRPVVYGPVAAWALWRILAARRPAVVALPRLAGRRVAAVIPTLDEAESLPTRAPRDPGGHGRRGDRRRRRLARRHGRDGSPARGARRRRDEARVRTGLRRRRRRNGRRRRRVPRRGRKRRSLLPARASACRCSTARRPSRSGRGSIPSGGRCSRTSNSGTGSLPYSSGWSTEFGYTTFLRCARSAATCSSASSSAR